MSEEKKESFLDSKAGTWGIGFPIVLLGIAFFFKGAILAGLTTLFMILGGGLAYGILALLALILVHGLFIDGWLMLKYQVFIKNIRRAIIDESPITILKIWKDKAQERMKEIRSGKDAVSAQEVKIQKDCDEFKTDFVRFQRRAQELEGNADKAFEFRSACGGMGKAAEMLKKSSERLAMIKGQYKRIDFAYKDLEAMYKEMEYEQKCLERDDETSNSLDKVWKNIRSIFKEENEWDQMRLEAIESLNNKYGDRMGRVESAINDCQGRFDEIKLDREIREGDGVAMYSSLKNMSVESLMTSPAISYSPSVPAFTPQASPVGVPVDAKWSNVVK